MLLAKTPLLLAYLAMSDFVEGGRYNTLHLIDAYESQEDMEAFLHDSEVRIPEFLSTYEWEEGLLQTKYDVDGVVVELGRLEGVKAQIPFITLPLASPKNIKPHYHMLKKHINLTEGSSGTRDALKHIHGCCLAHTAGGYFVNIIVVPRDLKAVNHAAFTSNIAPMLTAEDPVSGCQGSA